MKPETTRLHREFDEVLQQGTALAARLDDEALMRRPAAEKWSVAENLEHLSATAATYNRRIRRRLDASKISATFAHEKKSLVGRVWLSFVEPPPRMRLKVPAAALQPGEIVSREALLARFAETHGTLIALLEESDAYDRMRVRIPTAFAKRITVTLYDAFIVLAAHGRRHLWQAEKAVGGSQLRERNARRPRRLIWRRPAPPLRPGDALVWYLANGYAFFGTMEARLLRRRSSTMTPHRLRRVGLPSSLHRVE